MLRPVTWQFKCDQQSQQRQCQQTRFRQSTDQLSRAASRHVANPRHLHNAAEKVSAPNTATKSTFPKVHEKVTRRRHTLHSNKRWTRNRSTTRTHVPPHRPVPRLRAYDPKREGRAFQEHFARRHVATLSPVGWKASQSHRHE